MVDYGLENKCQRYFLSYTEQNLYECGSCHMHVMSLADKGDFNYSVANFCSTAWDEFPVRVMQSACGRLRLIIAAVILCPG